MLAMTARADPASSARLTPALLAAVQRTAGNAAAARLLRAPAAQAKTPPVIAVTDVRVADRVTVPRTATVRAAAVPANATGVVWSLDPGSVTPTNVTIDAATGVMTFTAGQEGGTITVRATSSDGSFATREIRVIEKPVAVTATSASGADNYGGQFVHTFSAPSGKVTGLEGANINEKFDALTATTPWGGGPFTLQANTAGSRGWDLDAAGQMAGPDNVTISHKGVNIGAAVQSASNPSPKPLPSSFTMKQHLHAKSLPGGTRDETPFTTVDHTRSFVAGEQFEVSAGLDKITESYDGPVAVHKAQASASTVEASPPRPKSGAWAQNTVTVTADSIPAGGTQKFSIRGSALGCTVDSSGTVSIGAQAGTITVRVSGGAGNFDEVKIVITARPKPPAVPKKTAELEPSAASDDTAEAPA